MKPVLISVLLPTRNRPALVERTVRSLLNLAQDPKSIEIMVAYDQDDRASQEYLSSPQWPELVESYEAKHGELCCEPWGYSGLHRYYTVLAQASNGQWLMIWNDDAVMLTQDWDVQVRLNQNFVGMMHMTTENFNKNLTLFPLIPRTWLDLFGSMSLHQCTDSWIQDICREAQAVRAIPVSVFHDRYDVTGNNLDATYENRRYDKKIYNHESMRQVRSEWAQKFMHHRHSVACVAKPDQI